MLVFSLHHLFCSIDTLYLVELPQLLAIASHQETGVSSGETLLVSFHIWNQLWKMKHICERLEPLCLLLNNATLSILDTLDIINSLRLEDSNASKSSLTSPDTQPAQSACEMETLSEHLAHWQDAFTHKSDHHSFVKQFSSLLPTIPSLQQLDIALEQLLEDSLALFGTTLPALQTASAASLDETIPHLLTMMQHSDMLLLQIHVALEPLQMLIRHYTLQTEMQ